MKTFCFAKDIHNQKTSKRFIPKITNPGTFRLLFPAKVTRKEKSNALSKYFIYLYLRNYEYTLQIRSIYIMTLKNLFLIIALPFLFTGYGNAIGKAKKKTSSDIDISALPKEIFSGHQGPFHVQGIAADLERGYFYFSFTTTLLKTDLKGNLIGSVTGMTGHLGCLTVDPTDGRLYGSLEYKNDPIGQGIRKQLNAGKNTREMPSAFYIAIFDPDRITRPDMDAEKDHVMTTVYLKEVVDDYYGETVSKGKKAAHRFGCSGIDGVSFGPKFGASKASKPYLHVAYGIYGDTGRSDNDYQVILCYDTRNWKRYERTLTQDAPHKSGPAKPRHKYFVRTGNTSYGIQNLAYDPATGNWLAAVYRGKKQEFPNYSLFMIDGSKAARKETLAGFDPPVKGEVLSLAKTGCYDKASDVYGWNFNWGTTGLCPIGNGYFYISHNACTADKKLQSSTVYLYRWTGEKENPFSRVE